MKTLFTLVLLVCLYENSFCQQLNTVHVLVPAKNIKPAAKMPITINGNKLVMKEGSYATLSLYADTAKFSFCSTDWTIKKGNTAIPLKNDIFVVAFFDETSTATNKYFFREVRLETFNQLRQRCTKKTQIIY